MRGAYFEAYLKVAQFVIAVTTWIEKKRNNAAYRNDKSTRDLA
jgi:hypothetical protein